MLHRNLLLLRRTRMTSFSTFSIILAAFCSVQSQNYRQVLEKSLLFYEGQRSGRLPANNRIPWRGDSMLEDGDGDVDLTGGYFDAGDHVKFNFPQAWALSTIAMGGLDFKEGFIASGQLNNLLEAYKWGADYYLKCHTGETELFVQVGNATADHNSWDIPERWTDPRPAYKITAERPGSDIAGETSALFSAGTLLFQTVNDTYASILLDHAKSLYTFANQYRGKYSDSVPEATPFYTSWAFEDEIAWAAAWLYRASGEERYLLEAEALYAEFNLQYVNDFSWDGKASGVDILLYQTTGRAEYGQKLISYCDWVVDQAPRTPKGLLFLSEWGSLRAASNSLFVCVQAGKLGLNTEKYFNFAKTQIDLMLGDWGRSFVVGYGTNPPTRYHHRAASCPSPPVPCGWSEFDNINPNPHVLNGALVGGPGPNDEYIDVRNDAVRNEVAVDYNAGFQGVVASLEEYFGSGKK
ncbi:endoglucanase E-4 [Folsomia candida]|uniref:cellulase n=1 Tax=Folsomia candida TaxID=158441 RepID=A0A226DQN3_FOLCA|nr:endoglucanase E-4 [Folsomia candida]XP_035712637.1 endoglucanase E-4 [Folsomia candida]OXA46991.1 Endoglucanase E-4 [Folsomia candida]